MIKEGYDGFVIKERCFEIAYRLRTFY